jgi:hypothetical protein
MINDEGIGRYNLDVVAARRRTNNAIFDFAVVKAQPHPLLGQDPNRFAENDEGAEVGCGA